MTMIEKFKILAKFIKDVSGETADVETYLFVKDHISKYQLNIDINSKALKNLIYMNQTFLKISTFSVWDWTCLVESQGRMRTVWLPINCKHRFGFVCSKPGE